ncbi:hypothetical protein [Pelagicoccus sp. SDUM812002]|uniref:hypothetical protein n=1 Tax=Pelagicoccus sp. SDUM812002 TaxID=3041266 RepID=UPI00280D4DE2|nr:hypothetical protein [Pelagicoccus sp. SDUM812002]MDQ8186637.1 hypothetical protein [Pelagicoccus sp. SDUM812002]
MSFLPSKTPLYIIGLGATILGYGLALDSPRFPASNAPARTGLSSKIDLSGATGPSPFGILTSRRWALGESYERTTLEPVANPNPAPEPQPRRDHPADVELSADGSKVYLALQGSELEPGSQIAVVDLETKKVLKRIPLALPGLEEAPASSPFRLISHPEGNHLLVVNRFSNFAVLLDTRSDEVVKEIPLDFYCQDGVYSPSGDSLYLTNRYLDQVFSLASHDGDLEMEVQGGLDDFGFLNSTDEADSVYSVLRQNCSAASCHDEERGGFYAGSDAVRSLASALDHVVPGEPMASRLLAATVSTRKGGYADAVPLFQGHAMGEVVFRDPDKDAGFQRIKRWIGGSQAGPGIPVGNPRSKPIACAVSSDGRYLFVGNTGTQDISIVDTRLQAEVGAIYIQNAVNDLVLYHDEALGRDYLLVATMGVGFGVTKERDPFAGESWDTGNPAAQYSVWRDPKTGLPLPRAEQEILGPFDAVDGTLEIKFRDIQNDILFVDVGSLDIPETVDSGGLEHILLANKYEAHRNWVRYTSDTAESTHGDVKGDIPPALMRVIGAFPDRMTVSEDRLFVTMQGSNSVQEWRINPSASDPIDYLVPVANYQTGLMPRGIAKGKVGTPSQDKLLVANFLGGSLSVIDRSSGLSEEIVVDPSILRMPFPATNAERGEVLVHTSSFSSDGDTSCIHCHAQDTGDGRTWGVSQVLGQEFLSKEAESGPIAIGGSMNVPQMRGLFAIQPFFFEGVISGYEPRSMMMEHCPADDFKAATPAGDFTEIQAHYVTGMQGDIQSKMDTSVDGESNLEERRDEMFRTISRDLFGKSFFMRDFQRFVGEWQMHEGRLLPNPFDQSSLSVARGRELFEDPQVGCISCHAPPHFTKKDFPDNPQQTIPPVVPFTVRDGSFTLLSKNREDANSGVRRDLEPWDLGRAEEQQGQLTIFPLRGIWDRPPVFLHNGLARTLREVTAMPGHPSLQRFKYEPLFGGYPERPGKMEVGFNMTFVFATAENRVKLHRIAESRLGFDTHGGTSQLTRREIDDLVNYMNSLE